MSHTAATGAHSKMRANQHPDPAQGIYIQASMPKLLGGEVLVLGSNLPFNHILWYSIMCFQAKCYK